MLLSYVYICYEYDLCCLHLINCCLHIIYFIALYYMVWSTYMYVEKKMQGKIKFDFIIMYKHLSKTFWLAKQPWHFIKTAFYEKYALWWLIYKTIKIENFWRKKKGLTSHMLRSECLYLLRPWIHISACKIIN